MKKTLFTLALASLVSTGFAQRVADVKKSEAFNLPTLNVQMQIAKDGVAAPKKNVSNGVYYQPQGGLWTGYDPFTGAGYYTTAYSVAPATPITYKNMCTGTPIWTINGKQVESTSLDSENNYTVNYSPSGMFYGPVVSVGGTSWSFGTNNLYTLAGVGKYSDPLVLTDSIFSLCLTSPAEAHESNGRYYNTAQIWGSLSTENMYGSGTITYSPEQTGLDHSVVGTCRSVEQVFPVLASPLYVEQVAIEGISVTGTPIASGKRLTVYITDVKTNDRGFKVAGDNILQTLYAESTDTLDFKTTTTRNNKTVYGGTVLFSKKTQDALGIETIDPFVIPAGQEYAVVVSGFEDAGIDFGPRARLTQSEYDLTDAAFYVSVPELESGFRHYYSGCVMDMSFYGMFDKAYIYTDGMYSNDVEGTDYSKIRVSADGKTVTCDGTSQEYNALPIVTGTQFFDGETEEPFYDIPNLPDWIHVTVDESYRDNQGVTLLYFTFDPLPEGTTGRNAALKLTSRGGVAANLPICVAQGDAEISGIEGVQISDAASKNDSRMFNLAGQQVGKNFKGIVVKNGKKMLVK